MTRPPTRAVRRPGGRHIRERVGLGRQTVGEVTQAPVQVQVVLAIRPDVGSIAGAVLAIGVPVAVTTMAGRQGHHVAAPTTAAPPRRPRAARPRPPGRSVR